MSSFIRLISVFIVLSLFGNTIAHELCKDATSPTAQPTLGFCTDYQNRSCCTPEDDGAISTRFFALADNFETSYPTCATYMKEVLCSECDPWGAHLFGVESNAPDRDVPFLCDTYCGDLYDNCGQVPLNRAQNPFKINTDTLAQTYPTKEAFCDAWTNAIDYCYSGVVFTIPPSNHTIDTTDAICIERIDDLQYVGFAAPNDNSGLIFAVEQAGRIWVLNKGNGTRIGLFLDLTPIVSFEGEKGLLNLAFHPDYATNGLFYVFYSCNQESCPTTCTTNDDCIAGRCVNNRCSFKNSDAPLDHYGYISEFRVSSNPLVAEPNEVRKLIRMEQPWTNHNGGFLAFGADGLLYSTIGDGGLGGDPELNGQDLTTILGKVIRINVTANVDGTPYTIPESNPFYNSDIVGIRKEIYAYGLRNTWRCSFDKMNPLYFICADVGQDQMEEVNLIIRAGNYGWHKYEGTRDYSPSEPAIPDAIFPVMEYDHSVGHSITGGYIYRGTKDACHCGKYIFGDFQDSRFFKGSEFPIGSGQYTRSDIGARCSTSDPDCTYPENIFSFGEDTDGELYIMGKTGLYRMTAPSECGIECPCDCMVDGRCMKDGDVNPMNNCQVCRATLPCGWSSIEGCAATTAPATTGAATTGSATTGADTTTGSVGTTGQPVPGSSTTGIVDEEESSGVKQWEGLYLYLLMLTSAVQFFFM